jgi:3-hydroxymyristoyl/3-hydroxydecanoyl-(acyl carrier protein) dehydratase
MNARTLSCECIKELLTYRYPMLLLDRVRIESETHAVGMKAISYNDIIFQGHFPNHPIMPGVLQVETIHQVATILMKGFFDPANTKDIYIKKLHKVGFRKPVLPGDRLKVDVNINMIEKNEAEVTASNFTNSGVTCQASMTISVREREFQLPVFSDFNDVDKNENIFMDVTKIMKIIPHRYPFLLIDYISSVDGADVVAVKNVTATEPFLHSYSPEYAVLPGAILIEIISQAGCVLTLLRPENEGKIAYFMSISDVEYFAPVRPGDQLKIELKIPPGGSRFGRGAGLISVEGKTAAKGNMVFALVDKKK